jgi:ElaB/YqjD/DUF883 family membrane-anchored ribosome-binding protein
MENGGRGGGMDPGQAGERLAGKAEELKGRAQEMKGRAEEKIGDLRDRASEQLDGVRGYAEDAGAWIGSFARERPMLAIGVAVGLGFLIGRIASRT